MICEKSQVLLFERNTPKRKRGQNSIWYHLTIFFSVKTEGGSPGLVIMGGDSCSKGREFESQHCILDGHISHLFVITIVMFVWKDKNKQKKAEDGPFFSQNRRRCHKTSFRNDAKYIEVSHCQSDVVESRNEYLQLLVTYFNVSLPAFFLWNASLSLTVYVKWYLAKLLK